MTAALSPLLTGSSWVGRHFTAVLFAVAGAYILGVYGAVWVIARREREDERDDCNYCPTPCAGCEKWDKA